MLRKSLMIVIALAMLVLSMQSGCVRVGDKEEPQFEFGTGNGGASVN